MDAVTKTIRRKRGRVMRFGTAIERLVDNYEYAKSKVWIRDEVAWALYHTWKEADDRKTEPTQNQHIQSVESVESVGEDRKTESNSEKPNNSKERSRE